MKKFFETTLLSLGCCLLAAPGWTAPGAAPRNSEHRLNGPVTGNVGGGPSAEPRGRNLILLPGSGDAAPDSDKDAGLVPEFAEDPVAKPERPALKTLQIWPERLQVSGPGAEPAGDAPQAISKRNTGWILDRHIYDQKPPPYPTLAADIRNFDEKGLDIAMGGDGFVWQVQSFYLTDIDPVGNFPGHTAPSYCLALMLSPDGGSIWYLYSVLYYPSKDIINAKIALDTTVSPERYFIAYEYAFSATDHDVYVYSNDALVGGTAQNVGMATSTLMERNPDIASDYTTGQTAYRVVAYEQEFAAGSSNYDLFARQSTGAGAAADWGAAVPVAATADTESNPSLFAGASITSQLLLNPGFELGNNGNWTASDAFIIDNSANPPPRTGTWKSWVAGYNNAFDTIYQAVTIPADAPSAGLSLYLRIETDETVATPFDFFRLQIRNTSGALLQTLATYSNVDATAFSAYTLLSYNLSAYRGQTIRIYMEATSNATNISSFLVDDTAVSITDAYMHLAYNFDTATGTHEVRYAKAIHFRGPSQLLLNPGFELGNNGNWTASDAFIIDNSANPPARTGTWKSWLAGYDNAFDTIYQAVTIPAGAPSAELSLYLRITTNEAPGPAFDFFRLQIRNTSGGLLGTLATYSNADSTAFSAYTPLRYNLNAYLGQTIRIYMEATTDGSLSSSFLVDDTAVSVSYPTSLAAATKIIVLTNLAADRPYGPPTVAASHGGNAAFPNARVVVAADLYFTANIPNAGDPARYQVALAWNMCNGGTTCGVIPCAPDPDLALNWQQGYFYDDKADERFPSLVVDGMGLGTNGVGYGAGEHPFIFLAYYHRALASLLPYGEAQMILTDANDGTCTGFASGSWFYFTAATDASDEDDLVLAIPNSIVAFNYRDGYPGVCFVKMVEHYQGTTNQDAFFTTIGDNYNFDTTYSGAHIDAHFTLLGDRFLGLYTFAWAAGYAWDVIADPTAVDNGRWYSFSSWSSGEVVPTVTVISDFCGGSPPCPQLDYTAFYFVGCLVNQPEVTGLLASRQGVSNVNMTWNAAPPQDVEYYAIYRSSTDATTAANFGQVGSSTSTTWLDTGAGAPLLYYIVVGGCGPYQGLWGHYGQ